VPDAPQVPVADRAAWRAWLAQHAAGSTGVWLVYDKGPGRRLSYDDIVEEALCFGWVDSLPRALDATHAMIYVAPRKPRSSWSRVNKARVERLIAAGAMTPAGLAVVAAARASGRWSAFPGSARRAILEWLDGAKRPETGARRVATVVAEAAEGRRANQWRQPNAAGRTGGHGGSQ
jgi:uncharacterized protein YdeI (YjbR/CyaY-like superfamily)